MTIRDLKKAPNGERALEAERWVEKALDANLQFKREFLDAQRWLVVPVESASHFDEQDAENIGEAAAASGNSKLRLILLEEVSRVENHMEVEATTEGLLLLTKTEYSHFNIALLPEDQSFAVICTTDDYFLVAGTKKLVETAIGSKTAEAYACFERFASDEFWEASWRSHLLEALRRYRAV